MGFVYRFIIIYFGDIDFGIYKNAMLAIWIEMLVENVWIKKGYEMEIMDVMYASLTVMGNVKTMNSLSKVPIETN